MSYYVAICKTCDMIFCCNALYRYIYITAACIYIYILIYINIHHTISLSGITPTPTNYYEAMKLIPGFILRQNGGGAYPMTKHLLTSSFTHVSLDWFKVNLQENVKKNMVSCRCSLKPTHWMPERDINILNVFTTVINYLDLQPI